MSGPALPVFERPRNFLESFVIKVKWFLHVIRVIRVI